MKRILAAIVFICVFLFYWNAGIANHTEADDAFEYAYMVETSHHAWLYHPHHLLYGAVTKSVYTVVQTLGYGGGAYSFLVFISALSAAGALFLFYRFCYQRYSMRPVSSLFATGFLALSYGFWRYACEAEVILPAGFLVLWAVYLATAPEPRKRQVVGAALVSGMSVLFHVMNGVPVFIAIPLFYLLQRRFRFAFLHSAIAGSLVLLAYLLVFFFKSDQLFTHALPALGDRLDGSMIPKGLVGFGQCLVSGNFLFSFSAFSDWLTRLFPARMLMEELYMGSHISRFHQVAPVLSLAALLATGWLGLVKAIGSWRKERSNEHANSLVVVGGWQTIAIVGLWFFIYAGAVLLLEPGNPEVWVLGLLPFWLLVCGLFIAPIARANELWIVLLMVVFLGLHNFVGGIGILRHAETDYNIQKAAWVLENLDEDHTLITAGNPVFVRYLNYHSKARVVDLNQHPLDALPDLLAGSAAVYLLNDVFDYPASMKVRFPSQAKTVGKAGRLLRPQVVQVAENEFGGVWKYVPPAPIQ